MESVVYWLGAGFSAPLGLPVMSDFLMKSKDQYAADTKRFHHFQPIFDKIDWLAKTKNFYATNLYDIEEILSLLEMNAVLTGEDEARTQFITYIRDVIAYYTPELSLGLNVNNWWRGTNWYELIFGRHPYRLYGSFVASLLGVKVPRAPQSSDPTSLLHCEQIKDRSCDYAVVTVNYDLILERFAALWGSCGGDCRRFATEVGGETVPMAKLHGSLDSGDLVPPTWNKSFHPEIDKTWRLAHKILSTANHLRIIGYSLPESDSYVRYLLKSAALDSKNLKSIDVICLDDSRGSVQQRYGAFIDFPYYRFVIANTEQYLSAIHERKRAQQISSAPGDVWVAHSELESAHAHFFSK